ncbi:nucleotidyltransferase family protein [Methylomusa anaerophila]|uniref:D-glycero-alpha-D-manno-heptose 1-phosphate guanylyltransferase n=1 Tax=Methylomusa anaerophila TaxID=1930071 RepID=A0A348AKV7_9FIRM|nr:nucleotidyltransferase family protein [Methylomusa anaerophila]BBB91705.1 D-glycero-alpha-D-manno-heptose 1-phosphate guanylyltransferase [Methylomusa anaerophila]
MKKWQNVLIGPEATIRQAIEVIDKAALQIALVVDTENHLLGTVTDGDIRRGIIRGMDLGERVELLMNRQPRSINRTYNREMLIQLMHLTGLRQIPVLDDKGRVIGLERLDELLQTSYYDNFVILMAGGLGTRLRPLTEDCPKPLLKVGNKPILETILGNFIEYGFRRFFISVNYKGDMIESYFGDGRKWNVDIRYLKENERLGPAGPLALLPEKPAHPVIVMNGDLLTKVNFRQLLDFHGQNNAAATMCVREYDFQVPFGVVKTESHWLLDIDEKPIHKFFVNAGIYVLQPEVLRFISDGGYCDMPELFNKIISNRLPTAVFPIREYWMDIGRMSDYEQVNVEYIEVFG